MALGVRSKRLRRGLRRRCRCRTAGAATSRRSRRVETSYASRAPGLDPTTELAVDGAVHDVHALVAPSQLVRHSAVASVYAFVDDGDPAGTDLTAEHELLGRLTGSTDAVRTSSARLHREDDAEALSSALDAACHSVASLDLDRASRHIMPVREGAAERGQHDAADREPDHRRGAGRPGARRPSRTPATPWVRGNADAHESWTRCLARHDRTLDLGQVRTVFHRTAEARCFAFLFAPPVSGCDGQTSVSSTDERLRYKKKKIARRDSASTAVPLTDASVLGLSRKPHSPRRAG